MSVITSLNTLLKLLQVLEKKVISPAWKEKVPLEAKIRPGGGGEILPFLTKFHQFKPRALLNE